MNNRINHDKTLIELKQAFPSHYIVRYSKSLNSDIYIKNSRVGIILVEIAGNGMVRPWKNCNIDIDSVKDCVRF